MICVLLPTSASAYSITNGKHGSDFASGVLAERLESIFYNGISGCVSPSIPAVGGSLNNNQAYTTTYANQSGSSTDWQCVAYARAAYSYLFGYNVGNSPAYQTSFYNATCGKNRVSYDLFQRLGVKCGAYLRTTKSPSGAWDPVNGHSILILGYDSVSITTLEGNYTGNGRIGILNYTWNDFNAQQLSGRGRYICGFAQPSEAVYASMGGSSLPTNLTISTNKGTYSLGETVVITPSANNATHYAISIWKGSFGTGTRLYANFNLPGAITFRPTQTGTYTIRADAKNSAGYISQERTFTVTTSTGLPTNFSIATDKSTYTSGEAVTITPSANNATRYAISIWLGSFGTGTRLYANFNLNGAVTFIPTQPGTYTIRADAKNNAGFISQECTFTVTAPSSLPTNMTVTTDKGGRIQCNAARPIPYASRL